MKPTDFFICYPLGNGAIDQFISKQRLLASALQADRFVSGQRRALAGKVATATVLPNISKNSML
jgi:hypothetical protein